MSEEKTIMERLLDNPDDLLKLMELTEEEGMRAVRMRRVETFDFIWNMNIMEFEEAIEIIKEREELFVEDTESRTIPEWLVRMEAQDVMMKVLYERLEEINPTEEDQ